jgi:hypothetical protein
VPALLLPTLASAATVVSSYARVDGGNSGVQAQSVHMETAALAASHIAQSTDNTMPWIRQAAASAKASVGTLGLEMHAAYSNAAGNDYPGSAQRQTEANAAAGWSETLMIGVPSATGLGAGHWFGMLEFSGSLASLATGGPTATSANAVVFATGLQPPVDLISGECDSGATVACISISGATASRQGTWLLPIDLHFVSGQPFDFHVSLSGVAQVYSGCQDCALSADVSFGHTLRWLGTTAVTDDAGHVLTDYTLTSESGFDYRSAAPVPEPGRLWLTALGVFALLARRCRPGDVP